jgi:hypothetical protein
MGIYTDIVLCFSELALLHSNYSNLTAQNFSLGVLVDKDVKIAAKMFD